MKNYANRRWYYSSYIIYITQKPDPLISNYYYSVKGANVIDFFVYAIKEAWDQGPERRKKAKTGSNRKNIGERFPLTRLPITPIFFSFFPNAEPVSRRQ